MEKTLSLCFTNNLSKPRFLSETQFWIKIFILTIGMSQVTYKIHCKLKDITSLCISLVAEILE